MKKPIKSIFLVSVVLSLCTSLIACSSLDAAQTAYLNGFVKQIDVPLTIIQGKTTQEEIFSKIGKPLNYDEDRLWYDLDKYKRLGIDLTYIEKDGDVFKYILRKNGTRNDTLVVDLKNNIVTSISVLQ